MPYREKRIYSGAMLEIERVHCTRSGRCICRRGSGNGTGKAQERINLKNARKRLMRLLCENFTKGDLFVTLTFDQLLCAEDRKKELAKFLRKLRTLCRRKSGQDLRYICVQEDRAVRPHFHLVCGAFDPSVMELQELWPFGRIDVGTLDGNPDYGWMARYLTKQKGDFRHKKRWNQSKNLREPYMPEPKILKRKNLASRPQVPKGYYVMSAYRQATGQGYEWEYVVAIREDRLQELPVEIRLKLEQSKVWGEFTGPEEDS